ncbi:hypothetical protein [Gulosibacter sediminis]|uniref:hypothetical protein n=1 Tax=Gulosibacter sediminis TaxID=1729695 RepID=UPI0024A7E753|nr:hypothetical protein [Gulosibacter sediminis]
MLAEITLVPPGDGNETVARIEVSDNEAAFLRRVVDALDGPSLSQTYVTLQVSASQTP